MSQPGGLNAATIEILLSKGLSGDDILDVARSLEAAQQTARSPAAVRQARYRQRGGGKIPEEMREAVFERDNYACAECGSEDYLQCDHVHPVSKGGETALENLQTLCRVCNARKRDRIRKRGKALGRSGGNSAELPAESPPKEYIQTPCSEPNGSGGSAADPVKDLFDVGVSILTATGTPEMRARTLLGKWRKSKGEVEVLKALLECRARAISQPIEWIEARFKTAKYVSASGYEYRSSDPETVMREAEKRADWSTYWGAKSDRDRQRTA